MKLVGLLLLILLTPLCWSYSELNGIATYNYLNKPTYMVGLFVEKPTSDISQLFDSSKHRKMELRVVADRIFSRNFCSLWIDGIAVNETKEVFDQHLDEVLKFARLFKGNLYRGDIITLHYFPKAGTKISVNNVELGTLQQKDIFNLLLGIWIGEVPLSSEIKKDLTLGNKGRIKKNYLTVFHELRPDQERIQEVKAWLAETTLTVAQETTTPVRKAVKAVKPSSTPKSTEAPSKKSKVSPSGTKTKTTEQKEKKTTVKKPVEATQKQPTQAISSETKQVDPEASFLFSRTSILRRKEYINKLYKHIKRNTRIPILIDKKPHKESIMADITVDKTGKIFNLSLSGKRARGMLEKGVKEAVDRATPFPPIPEQIGSNTVTFKAHFSMHWRYKKQ